MFRIYDYLYFGFILVAALVVFFVSSKKFQINQNDPLVIEGKLNTAPFEYLHLRKAWLDTAIITLALDYLLNILSFGGSIIVIFVVTDDTIEGYITLKTIMYSVLSLIFSLFGILFQPKKFATNFRKAFVILDRAIHDLEYGPRIVDENMRAEKYLKLSEAVNKGEEEIAGSYY